MLTLFWEKTEYSTLIFLNFFHLIQFIFNRKSHFLALHISCTIDAHIHIFELDFLIPFFQCHICFSGCGLHCRDTHLELVFVIHGSESVGPENFELIKDFVSAVIDRVSVSTVGTRIGVVLYSHVHTVVAGLQELSSQTDIKAAIKQMPFLGEGTFTGSAIHQATKMFQASQPSVRKVAMVLTEDHADPRDDVKYEETAREAHAQGIEMFVVGVKNKTDALYGQFQREVNIIASDPDEQHVFLIDDYQTLHSKQQVVVFLHYVVM